MKRKFLAFTLAEVLITLSIIGIVAAITIPTLINNYQKKQYVTSLKKFYSTFNQSLNQLAVDYGCPGDLPCTGLLTTADVSVFGTAISKYFKIANLCGITSFKGCFPYQTFYYYDGYDRANQWTQFDSNPNYYKFSTVDGMSVAIYSLATNGANWADCKFGGWSRGITNDLKKACAEVVVDVNGNKLPNTYGRDTFQFWITNGHGLKLHPYGGIDYGASYVLNNPQECSSGNTDGAQCAARIMNEGWEMNY